MPYLTTGFFAVVWRINLRVGEIRFDELCCVVCSVISMKQNEFATLNSAVAEEIGCQHYETNPPVTAGILSFI